MTSARRGANSVVIQTDGKIVVAGATNTDIVSEAVALVRYNADGSLDTTFDGDGQVFTTGAIADAAAIQTDGKILVGGASSDGYFAVFRYNADGSLDNSCGNGGKSLIRHLS